MTEQDRQRAIRGKLARMERPETSFIATGWPSLDSALGGGLPRGGIVELFGASGSGKSTLTLQLVAEVQRCGNSAAWIDADHVFDASYAACSGVLTGKMPVLQPQSAEEAFAIAERLLASQAVDLLVVDSAAALVPQLELQTSLGENGPGLQGRVMISGLRRMAQALRRADATALFLNQARAEEGSAGGPGLKLYAAVRILLEPAARDKAHFRILKNRAGEPFRDGQLRWQTGLGFIECL